MEAQLAIVVVECGVELMRPMDPAAIDDHHPIGLVLDPTIVTQMTHGPDGSAQQRVSSGDAHVTPIAATRARLLLGAASAGVRNARILRFTPTDARRARIGADDGRRPDGGHLP